MKFARLWWVPASLALTVGFALPRTSRGDEDSSAGKRFAVATENEQATRAAMQTLRQGGHAVDAAVTAALVLGVVNPTSSGLGGGGFALVWDQKSGKMTALDFRETAPRAIVADALATRPVPDQKRGVLVGAPGEVAGLAELHRRWGRKTFAANAEPAIRAATQGYRVERHLAHALRTYGDDLIKSEPVAVLFFPHGVALGVGARVRNPRLGRTIAAVAKAGPRAFYTGPIAADIAAAVQRFGGVRSTRKTSHPTRWWSVDPCM